MGAQIARFAWCGLLNWQADRTPFWAEEGDTKTNSYKKYGRDGLIWQGWRFNTTQERGFSGVEMRSGCKMPPKLPEVVCYEANVSSGRSGGLIGRRFDMQGAGGEGNFGAVCLDDGSDFKQHILLDLMVMLPDNRPGEGVDEEIQR